MWYHALNRGNGGQVVFRKPADYEAFVQTIADARARLAVDILGYCLLPTHFHIVLRPHDDGDLGRWMQWLLTAHVRRHHSLYGTSGHIWQGRFVAFPVQNDDHLATVLRYVESNPLRASRVKHVKDWKWSSLPGWLEGDRLLWRGKPEVRDKGWVTRITRPLATGDLEQVRKSVSRGRPFGDEKWTLKTAERLGISLRPPGRPRKIER
jgi:putative transposase